MDLGKRIRETRARRKITLGDLTKDAGLTISFLSQVERGVTSPSLKSLRKIADALKVKVGSLLEDEQKEIVFIRKSKEEKTLKKRVKSSCQILASDMLNINMKPLIFTIAAGGRIEKELSSYTGEKFGMLLEGKLALYCDKQRFIMGKGDSIYCAYTKKPDKIVNIGKRVARILWVILERPGQWVH
jgi:transcriptional regulator with XRE-family HTH domain